MAENTNLTTSIRDNGAIVVSWTDKKSMGMYPRLSKFLAFSWGIAFAISIFIAVPSEDHTGPAILVGILVAGFLIGQNALRSQKTISFTQSKVRFEGVDVPTKDVTRIDYGPRSQLTGERPMRDADPRVEWADPVFIRIWQNDTKAHRVGVNVWNLESNHEIREALARALDDVRKTQAAAERKETYGSTDATDDSGIPDY